jgi:putative heme-binding domain-containing protein
MAGVRVRPSQTLFAIALLAASAGAAVAPASAQEGPRANAQEKAAAKSRPRAAAPTGPAPAATPVGRLKTLKGFKVELVHDVSREGEGSWVSMTIDPKGRLIVSDQYGKLFRVTPSPVGGPASATKVEPIPAGIGMAHGLLWAFDSLYVMVNRDRPDPKLPSGLYRVRDTDGDDRLDKVELLRKLDGGGEHGPHAVVLSPDGKSLHVVAGNATRLPELAGSVVPRVWGEDNLIPHMPDGAGFMRDEKAPGGWVCKVDPEGKSWELVSSGYRNAYDIAFNRDGELFTYDSDMEWDMSLPWYRPTRVCHVTSGSEFGYRNGSGKWPTYYPDSLPPVVDIGPGSPTGVAFGYGAKFPAKYQDAFFISDWSYGKLYAVHLTPKGSSYSAEFEEFLSGSPLPLTDLVVNPNDGALYFAIGGRRTTSGLYRLVNDGPDSTSPSPGSPEGAEARKVRHSIEAFHGHEDPQAVETAWRYLNHPDRFIRFAARVALEFQDVSTWRQKALYEPDPGKALPALLALIRVSAQDPAHRKPGDPAPSPALKSEILAALDRLGGAIHSDSSRSSPLTSEEDRLNLARVYQVLFVRFGRSDHATAEKVLARLSPWFPSASRDLNSELSRLSVYLGSPSAAWKLVGLLAKAPTQEEQIDYAATLRVLKTGWAPELRMAYFAWFLKAAGYKGGNSFRGFMRNIKTDALANLGDDEKADLKPIIDAAPPSSSIAQAATPRPFVKNWTLDELVPLVENGLHGRDYAKGRALFAAASCFACHRFNNEGGGAGPDLSGVAGRFSVRDLLESVVAPSKVISDQYGAVMISTDDGRVVTGRIVNLHGDTLSVNTNMLDPNMQVSVNRRRIEEMKPSPVSMMPEGLFNTLNRDEVLDLTAYLMSRGDSRAEVFRKP